MKRAVMIFFCVTGTVQGWGAEDRSINEQVKALTQRYNQIEAQLDRSTHYARTTNEAGLTRLEQAWLNGADDLIKVSVDETGPSGRDLIEYVGDDLDWPSTGDCIRCGFGMFFLHRKETPQADGSTEVEETRQYFGTKNGSNGELLREIRKKAHFKPGEMLDTIQTPNVVVDLGKQAKDGRTDAEQMHAHDEFLLKPSKIVAELKKSRPPVSDLLSAANGDSEKFRAIHGTVSPDGRYAIALGFARGEIDWNQLVDKHSDESGRTYYAEGKDDIRNYVVDVAQQKILGETGCSYFGTGRRYNQRECVVTWSPDSAVFVQLWDDKWASEMCVAGKIDPNSNFAGAVNVIEAISRKTYAFAKKRFDPEQDQSLTFSVNKVSNDGIIDLNASEVNPSVPHKGETLFAVNTRLRLSGGPKGPHLQILNMRRLPKEQ